MTIKSKKVIAIHVPSKTNLGDALSTPIHYFPQFSEQFDLSVLSIAAIDRIRKIPEDVPVLFGGGGLLTNKPNWNEAILAFLERTRYAIAWGVGLNRSQRFASLPGNLPTFMQRFRYFGVRDWLPNTPWVPCASAMSTFLDIDLRPTRFYGVFLHGDRTDRLPKEIFVHAVNGNFLTNFNGADSFQHVVKFISSSEVLVTNSYHGMYWATLLKRPVILFDVFSEKFMRTRWPAVTYEEHGTLTKAVQAAQVYPLALQQARQANSDFFTKVWTDLV